MGERVNIQSLTLAFVNPATDRDIYRRLFARKPTGKTYLFRDAHLTIQPGEKLCLLGPNGSGKTTLLKILSGLLSAPQGRICVGDKAQPLVDRRKIGCMFSLQFLYEDLTGYQNLEYTAALFQVSRPRFCIDYALDYWGLKSSADAQVSTYSQGMKARLALARAVIHRPSLLCLDEPAVFLDTEGMERLQNFLKTSSATTVFTTHQQNLPSWADRIVDIRRLSAFE